MKRGCNLKLYSITQLIIEKDYELLNNVEFANYHLRCAVETGDMKMIKFVFGDKKFEKEVYVDTKNVIGNREIVDYLLDRDVGSKTSMLHI